MEQVTIRDANLADLSAVAATHREAFGGFFLTKLGPKFLRCYYDIVMSYPGGIVCVACSDSGIVGFVAGYRDPRSFFSHLVRNWWRLLIPVCVGLLKRPSLLWAVAVRLRRARRSSRDSRLGAIHAELASLAVHPAAGGGGVGGQLVSVFCDRAALIGCGAVTLTTDADANDRVNQFYRRHGFVANETFLTGGGRRMHRYFKSIVNR